MNPYLSLLYQAWDTPLGIKVRHENPPSARAQFYLARKGHPTLAQISVTILEDEPGVLYLVRPAAPCPSENQPHSSEPTSGSLTTTSDGSTIPTMKPSE